jgi:hypothetical protein
VAPFFGLLLRLQFLEGRAGAAASLFLTVPFPAKALIDLLYLFLGHAPAKETVLEIRFFFSGGRHRVLFLLVSEILHYKCSIMARGLTDSPS